MEKKKKVGVRWKDVNTVEKCVVEKKGPPNLARNH